MAIHGLFEPGEHVITTQLEHNSVLRPLYMQRERGVGVDIVPCSDAGIKRGIISPSDIEALIRPDTKASYAHMLQISQATWWILSR